MARKEKRNVRFDNRHVRLRTGETQRKTGMSTDGQLPMASGIRFSQQRLIRCEIWKPSLR